MKPDKHFASTAVIIIAAACLIALTWGGTIQVISVQRAEAINRTTVTLANQALTFTEQINRQILGFDQTLRILVAAWEANPRGFNLEVWRRQTFVLDGLSRDMVLTDENGVIRQSSVVEAINQNASGLDYFRVLSDPSEQGDRLYIGAAAIDGIMRQWHMNVARALHHPDGSFAGVIDADYRIAAITDVFRQIELGSDTFFALAGLEDGKLRGAVSATTIDPDINISETQMFAAIAGADSGIWTGPSANDAVRRIHAYRHIPGRKFAVVVAVSEGEILRSIKTSRRETVLAAGVITMLVIGLAIVLVQATRLGRRRRAQAAEARATLAAANAQFEVARALAIARAEQLETTLAGISDGVSMIDAHLCLVEWNARFPELAGVPEEILRVGLPMEEILRAQVRGGQFGIVNDDEAEVAREMARLRVAQSGIVRRRRPDGHTLELRRSRLPDGGFVTVYTDTTGHERADEALRQARIAVATANAETARFFAMIRHEIRAPLNALQNAIQLLADSILAPPERSLVTIARQASESLMGLVSDVLDTSQLEAGKLAIRPSHFHLRQMLDGCVEMLASQAVEWRQSLRVAVAEGTPVTLFADPARVRQVLLNLLSNALNFAPAGEVWLIAEPERDSTEAIRISIKDQGPGITPEVRTHLFQPLDPQPARDSGHPTQGLTICRHLVAQMGGQIGCETWRLENGVEGNAFWITLPVAALSRDAKLDAAENPVDPAAAIERAPIRLPQPVVRRTRVLLTGDLSASHGVTATLLRREGHHVDLSPNGPAAIEALRSIPYDLVLMDVFMPGLDELDVVKIIRAMPEPVCSLPIVALTANAATQNGATVDAAGMNGVLAKPVSLTALLEVLRQDVWAKPIASDLTALPRPDPGQVPVAPVLSTRRINELRAAVPAATLVGAIEDCLVDIDRRLPALRRSLAARAPGAITAHAEAIIGMAAAYGMVALEGRLRSIATAARQGDLGTLGPTVAAELDKDFEQAAFSLREIVRAEMA